MTEKRMPEVGDVWEYQGKLYHISEVVNGCARVWCLSIDTQMNRHNWLIGGFVECFTYKGKSKANINDLFEVEQ